MPTIHHGDCIETMKAMPPESVDAIVCDPPYGLSNTTPAQVAETITKWAGGDRDHVPTGRGFMGKSWDAFVPPPAVWDECLRVLKPGGHMVVFAGSRTHDLMGLSIRLAGFEMRDSLAWLYGSGFPKSHDVSKAIDRMAGAEREVIGSKITGNAKQSSSRTGEFADGKHGGQQVVDVTAPATPEAAQWDGWGTALKPAFEPIVLARKPFPGTVARNVLEHGTGAINVDACRIEGTPQPGSPSAQSTFGSTTGYTPTGMPNVPGNPSGRWPANVLLDQHAAAWVDEQSGLQKDGVAVNRNKNPDIEKPHTVYGGGWMNGDRPDITYGGGGGASRFFYTAKAPKRERPTYTRPVLRLRDNLTPAQADHVRARLQEAGISLD